MLTELITAMQAGQEIANPAKWKNIGNLTRAITSVLSILVVIYRLLIGELPITDEQLIAVSGSIATLLMVFSNIIAVVTTKKNVSIVGITKNAGAE